MQKRTFGFREPGQTYRTRPGAYAVMFDSMGNVALVEAPAAHGIERWLFLPGGGIEAGEMAEDCIRRECLEEIGCSVMVGDGVCIGDEYLFAPSDQTHLHVIGRCYLAKFGNQVQEPVEQDHILKWIPVERCAEQMFLRYQAWAVTLAWEMELRRRSGG